jgi:hypothetical protein
MSSSCNEEGTSDHITVKVHTPVGARV